MVRCPRDFRAICTAVAPDAVGTLRIYNPTPPVYDGHLVPCSSDHNRAIMPNCELQPRELLKNVPTRETSTQVLIDQVKKFGNTQLAAQAADMVEADRASTIVATGKTVEDAVDQLSWLDEELIILGSSRLASPSHIFL